MAWVAVDKDGRECIYQFRPKRGNNQFRPKGRNNPFIPLYEYSMWMALPKGSIKKLIGRDLDWSNEPVELKEDIQETILISMEDYHRYLSYANYMENWASDTYKCPICGTLNPRGYICIECNRDVTK